LLLGSALALFIAAGADWRKPLRRAVWPSVACLAAILVLSQQLPGSGFRDWITWTLTVVSSAAVIGGLVTQPLPFVTAFLGSPPLRFLGRISYSVYLWHFLIIVLLYRERRVTLSASHYRASVYLSVIVGTLIVAVISHFVIERPFLRLKVRFERTPDDRARAARGIDASS
jgi:peptidoglycan/LPS O-acetylase OafA/YrhL